MSLSDWDNLIDILLIILPALFIIIYTVLSPWWRASVSRAICGLMASIIMIVLPRPFAVLLDIPIHTAAYTEMEVFFKIPVVLSVTWCVGVLIDLQRKRAMLGRYKQDN